MKILITGSQGFLGKSLAHYAVRNGHHVLGVSRSDADGLIAGMESIRCGLDQAGFVDVLNGFAPDVVVHAAGSASVGYSFQQPREDFLMAVETWASVLDAVRKAEGNPLVIFPSSASVYGNPTRLPVPEGAGLQIRHGLPRRGDHLVDHVREQPRQCCKVQQGDKVQRRGKGWKRHEIDRAPGKENQKIAC